MFKENTEKAVKQTVTKRGLHTVAAEQSSGGKTGQGENHTLESEKRHVGVLFNREERDQPELRAVWWDLLPQQGVDYIHNTTHTQDHTLIPY